MVTNVKTTNTLSEDYAFFEKSAFFKLYLFLIIILNHALNFEAYGLKDSDNVAATILYFLEQLEYNISWLSISMYYFISGYGFMLGFKLSKTFSKWKRRIFSVLIPWILWNTIMWLMGITMESVPFISSKLNSGFGFELSLRSWLVHGLLGPADSPLWFMSNLIADILLAPVIYLLIKDKYVGIVSIVSCYVAVYFTAADRYSILMSVLFFMQAGYFALHLRHLVKRSYGTKARIAACFVLLLYLIFGLDPRINNGTILYALVFSVTAPALWVAFDDVKLSKKEKKVEEYRFWLYASHYLPLECVEKLWLIVGGISVVNAWVGMIICPTVTVLLLIGIGYLVKKYCYPLWCVLNGKKIKTSRA